MVINIWLSNGFQYIVIKWLSNGYQYMVIKWLSIHSYQMVIKWISIHGYQIKNMFGFLFKRFTQLSMVILFMFVYLFKLITPKFINVLGVDSHMFCIGKS